MKVILITIGAVFLIALAFYLFAWYFLPCDETERNNR